MTRNHHNPPLVRNCFPSCAPAAIGLLLLFLVFPQNVRAQAGTVPLPTNQVFVTIGPFTTNLFLITNSFVWLDLSLLPGGYCVTNGRYSAWCVEALTPLAEDPYYPRLWDSLGTNLPPHLLSELWSQINYVLNHKLGDAIEVQEAIWYVQDGTDLMDIDPGPIRDMVAAARQFGPGYVPPPGQTRAIILDPTNVVQRLIIETTCTAASEPGAVALSITRSNNTVAVAWPSPSTGWTLQQNTNTVNSVNWSNVPTTPLDDGTTKTLIVNPPTGNRFYRLFKP
jgi:hypothetical protein